MPDEIQLSLQLRQITDCFSSLNVVEKRCLNDEFVELVFSNKELDEWYRIVSAFLGAPTKPQGKEPSEQDLKITSATGGIRLDQTLFEHEFENGTIVAKFWPWQDNAHITLKMALLMK